MAKIVDSLDHAIPFTLALTIAVICWAALLTWGFKRAGMPGPAMLVQHP